MSKANQLDEKEIVTAIDWEIDQWEGDGSTKLSEQREQAMEYYYGLPFGNEKQDQSQIVTREVLDTIEWIKPELMKLFASGDDTVRFEPQGPDDVASAEQETDYINYLFTRKNKGFKVLYEWITDGLLQKNGVVKCWWDKDKSIVKERYEGLTDSMLHMLLADEAVELLEQDTVEGEINGTPTPLHNVSVAVTGAQNGLKIEPLPPEEFIISQRAKDIATSPFTCHRRLMPLSDIRDMGFDVADDAELDWDSSVRWGEEYQARHKYDRTDTREESTASSDAMREAWVDEAYIRIDANGDGIAELLQVFKSGTTVFSTEEVSHPPFAGWTPLIISHKYHGLSMADLVMDLQRLNSQLWRNMLDNQYLTNNGRYAAVENMVNMEDLLSSRPHGAVRIKTPGAVTRLDTPQLGATAFQMLEYVDRQREKRTGVSERTQGLDPSALGPNTHTGAVNQVMTAAQQRIELIARVFAETGLTDLFLLMHKEVKTNATATDVFRLRDEYHEVDPSSWRDRMDMSVVVGLGNGSKDMEAQQLNLIAQQQLQLASHPRFEHIVLPSNVFNVMEDLVKVTSKSSSGRYFTNPKSQEAQQAEQGKKQEQMMMMQKQEAMAKQQVELAAREVGVKEAKVKGDIQKGQQDVQTDRMKLAQDDEHHSDEIALDTAELQLEAHLEATQDRGVDLG